jgi:hypothetical protein
MADAYIYDAVRTPRGKGKKDGSLHEITALSLATQVLEQLRDRNNLDTNYVDDVILGCVAPVGEQGADIARTAVLTADYAQTTAGVQINRFCASGLEACNMAAAKVMVGEADHGHRRRRREHEPRADGQRRRGLAGRSVQRLQDLFRAPGHQRRPDRHPARLLPRRRRRLCGREPEARRPVVEGRPVRSRSSG